MQQFFCADCRQTEIHCKNVVVLKIKLVTGINSHNQTINTARVQTLDAKEKEHFKVNNGCKTDNRNQYKM